MYNEVPTYESQPQFSINLILLTLTLHSHHVHSFLHTKIQQLITMYAPNINPP
jgi:hypothetical protein